MHEHEHEHTAIFQTWGNITSVQALPFSRWESNMTELYITHGERESERERERDRERETNFNHAKEPVLHS